MNSVEDILAAAVYNEIASGLSRKYILRQQFDAGLLESYFYGVHLDMRAGKHDAAVEQLRRANDELIAGQTVLAETKVKEYGKEIRDVFFATMSYAS